MNAILKKRGPSFLNRLMGGLGRVALHDHLKSRCLLTSLISLIVVLSFSPCLLAETEVGGIITTDRVWQVSGSPFVLASEVQVDENATLTIEPGVSVVGPGTMTFWGTLSAIGNQNSRVYFDEVYISTNQTSIHPVVVLRYVEMISSRIELRKGDLIITDSIIESSDRKIDLVNLWNTQNLEISRNIFINSCGIWTYGCNNEVQPIILNNVFYNEQYCGGAFGPSDLSYAINIYGYDLPCENSPLVSNNSFLNTDLIAIMISSTCNGCKFPAGNNYWNTQDVTVISSMIYDRNDDLNIRTWIDYSPILKEPHPMTPTSDQLPLSVDFYAERTRVILPSGLVSFISLCNGHIDSYEWDFGDGEKGFTKNPSHAYTQPGDYTVSLKVSGPEGTLVESKEDYIRIRYFPSAITAILFGN